MNDTIKRTMYKDPLRQGAHETGTFVLQILDFTRRDLCRNLKSDVFCGVRIEDHVPDPSTLSRFRKELTQKA